MSGEFGLKVYKPAEKPRLHLLKAKRFEFAQVHFDWTTEKWRKVLFSDESSVQEFTPNKRIAKNRLVPGIKIVIPSRI